MALPEHFIARINSYGSPVFDGLIPALEGEPVVSVRYNPARQPDDDDSALMRVPWCDAGRYLPSRPAFTFDPAMHQGRYYVQDASSMFVAHVVRHLTADACEPLAVLDACAAPGGKTTAVIDSLPAGSLVVANEFIPARAAVLSENIRKWGYPFCVVSRGDTARFRRLTGLFDMVIADVPCSGEGMMRKDPAAAAQWSESLIEQCVGRQREIVDNLWPALRPGGYMIYSTCTFNRDENEMMARYITDTLGGEAVEIPVDPEWNIAPGIDTALPCYRFIPGRIEGEGLFMFVARKPASPVPVRKKAPRRRGEKTDPAIANALTWINSGNEDMTASLYGDSVYLFPARWKEMADMLDHSLDVIYRGIEAGIRKGRDIIPSQALALSRMLDRSAFPVHDIDRDEALRYLHGEAMTLPPTVPRGHILLTYRDVPLGFVKNLGNRANNLYPDRWRIISEVKGR